MSNQLIYPTNRNLHVLDTFAGAGGFSLGFQLAGFEVIGAIEIDKWACETFSYNHPDAQVVQDDISKLSDNKLYDLFSKKQPNVLIGGPPCQGFSIANRNAGDPKDPRNSLFKEFLRVGQIFKPSIMVMENVPNLISAKTTEGESVINIITASLENLGYNTYTAILQAINFGVPQIRSRLFVIASLHSIKEPFPVSTHNNGHCNDDFLPFLDSSLPSCPSLWDAISDLPELNAGDGDEILSYVLQPQNNYQTILRENSPAIFNHKAMNHTKRMIERFSTMKWGDSVNDVPDHLKPRRRNSGELATTAYDQNNRRMFPYRPCHTIPASFYANFVHPFQQRNFTAREGARIQSFPDWYRFMGKPTVVSHKLLAREERHEELHLCQYNQIGNAVPPLLAKAIAENIIRQLEGTNNVCSRKQLRTERNAPVEIS